MKNNFSFFLNFLIFGFVHSSFAQNIAPVIPDLEDQILNEDGSASIWITATMINNILIDFNEMIIENERLKSLNDLTMNDRLKLFSNGLLLKDTAINTVSSVCIALIVVFSAKNISLYIKNITLSIVQYRLIRDLRNKLYSHFHYLSLSLIQPFFYPQF